MFTIAECKVCVSLVLVHDSNKLVMVLLHGLLDILAYHLVFQPLLFSRLGRLVQVGMAAFQYELWILEISEQWHHVLDYDVLPRR